MTHRLWIVAGVLVVAALGYVNWGWRGEVSEASRRAQDRIARVAAGKQALMTREVSGMGGRNIDASLLEAQIEVLVQFENEPADRIDRAVLTGELLDGTEALRVLDGLGDDVEDVALLTRLYKGGELTAADRATLAAEGGWYGRLASIHGVPDDDPLRAEMIDASRRSAAIMSGLFVAALLAFVTGCALLVIALIRLRRGELRSRFRLHDQGSGDLVWLQTAVLGLAGVLALNIGLFRHSGIPVGVAMWLLFVPMLWPLARGTGWTEWRGALGYLRGDGVVKEIIAGVQGYLAGLPLILLGFWVSLKLIAITGWEAGHPVQDELTDAGQPVWGVVIAACVWAPLVEETLFRGALYRYLRPSLSVLGASVLTGALFAFVHPQGLAFLPALGAVGIVLGLLREWRGSLTASMTAHALHNGAMITAALAIFR